jgi:hypothetical protein
MLVGAYLQTPLAGIDVSKVVGADSELLRCVWSDHPNHDHDCRACIPVDVVATAWRRENEEYGLPEGFFYFTWNDGVWLAYGFRDGRVRGVYCPTHCAERTANLLRPELHDLSV